MNRLIQLLIMCCTISSCSPRLTKFRIEKEVIKLPAKASFINYSSDADRYEWDFGDGNRSVLKDPKHQYSRSGIYHVTLKTFHGNKVKSMQHKIEVLPPDGCYVLIETPFGTMTAKLYDQTPLHRDNFFKHAEQGYYDGLIFHRVIEGFMIQGGDPKSKNATQSAMLGGGGPGYTIPAEFNQAFIHKKGALAAARTGDQVNPKKESSGSQFYIVHGNLQTAAGLDQVEDRKGIKYTMEQRAAYQEIGGTPFLDQEYTVFGEITDGLEIIDKIASVATDKSDRPLENVVMKIKVLH